MATTRNNPHIIIPTAEFRKIEGYKPHKKKITSESPGASIIGRPAHAAALKSSFEKAVDDASRRRSSVGFEISDVQPGVYLEFESLPGWELAVASLENTRSKDRYKHIEVIAVSKRSVVDVEGESTRHTQHAAVFVPDGQVKYFLNQLEKYALTTSKKFRERRHEDVYDRIMDPETGDTARVVDRRRGAVPRER